MRNARRKGAKRIIDHKTTDHWTTKIRKKEEKDDEEEGTAEDEQDL